MAAAYRWQQRLTDFYPTTAEHEMVKKLRALTESDDNQLVEAVRSSAHLIWQAGLGALSRAQEEGDKAFANLMSAGSHLQRRMRGADGSQATDLVGSIGSAADTIGKQPADSWGKFEHAFEGRLARALQNMGVPSRDDIQQLAARIEELQKMLEVLPNNGAPVSGKVPVAATARVAVKKTVAKAPAKTARKAIPKKPAMKAGAGAAESNAPEQSV
jgi:poly(hydroxyalkanoate) granule-associated protein